jgi:hypothetical protein
LLYSSAMRSGLVVLSLLLMIAFAPYVLRAGFYLDDLGFLLSLGGAGWESFKAQFLSYVPGRNIQIAYWWLLINGTGTSAFLMHLVGLAIIWATSALTYAVVFAWTGLASLALPVALILTLMMNHGESHFWLSALLQAQLSLAFVLAALYAARQAPGGAGARTGWALLAYTLGFFSYDQVFFLWPLVLVALWRSGRPGESWRLPLTLGSVWCLGLEVFHFLIRHFATVSGGGRPVVRLGALLERFRSSVWGTLKGTFAVPTRGSYELWGTIALGLLAALIAGWIIGWCLLRADRERAAIKKFCATPGPLRLAVFGAAWFLLGYLPVYFWYISPRHNHVPSFGWALMLVAAAAWSMQRWPWCARALPLAAWLLLGNALAAQWLEGSEWLAAAKLHRDFVSESRKLDGPVDNVFLLGAPRHLRKGPTFNLPHDTVMRVARDRNLSINAVAGASDIAPSAAGLFYHVDQTLTGPEAISWLPWDKANIIAYRPDGTFACLGALRLILPDGSTREVRLRQSWGCDAVHSWPADVFPVPEPGPEGWFQYSGYARLRLRGTAAHPRQRMAFYTDLRNSAGQLLWRPVYPMKDRHHRSHIYYPLTIYPGQVRSWLIRTPKNVDNHKAILTFTPALFSRSPAIRDAKSASLPLKVTVASH